MPGYSGKPLAQKLGIKAGHKVLVVSGPRDYRSLVEPLPNGVSLRRSGNGPFDMIHVFSKQAQALEPELRRLEVIMPDDGMIWVSWPKKSSGSATDLDENAVREVALRIGLVDVKVCAVDETWSGLKLVRRLKDRADR
ncbi:MAG TPA: DUF3052 family protein [Anaerolineales bacterium]|nr:DUF3052 family protein [Anaerolineales bacterium]